jgi:hypothetical protein
VSRPSTLFCSLFAEPTFAVQQIFGASACLVETPGLRPARSHKGLPQRVTFSEYLLCLTHVMVDFVRQMSHDVHIVNETGDRF